MSDELDELLKDIDAGQEPPLILVVGEEYLARRAAEAISSRLLPDAAVGLNKVVLDAASPQEVAAELATLSLFPGRKVVEVRDPEFLAPKKGRVDALGKAREAWKANRRKEAARRVLALAARAGFGVAELEEGSSVGPVEWREELGVELEVADRRFLAEVAAFCREEGLSAPESDDRSLLSLLEGRLPKGHTLLVVTSALDSKSPVAQFAKKKGYYVERKVAAKLKDLDVTDLVAATLAPLGKSLEPAAAAVLKDRCGGNMRLLQSELEKVALFVQGGVIKASDVRLLVRHAREEEFLELSDAIQKRSFPDALRYVEESLGQGAAPLALLGAVAAVLRGLVVSHERMSELTGGRPPKTYNEFQAKVFPSIEAEAKAAKGRVPHPYGAFMSMQAAARYSRAELLRALASCAESDLALKLGGTPLVIERLLWSVCGQARPWDTVFELVPREMGR